MDTERGRKKTGTGTKEMGTEWCSNTTEKHLWWDTQRAIA